MLLPQINRSSLWGPRKFRELQSVRKLTSQTANKLMVKHTSNNVIHSCTSTSINCHIFPEIPLFAKIFNTSVGWRDGGRWEGVGVVYPVWLVLHCLLSTGATPWKVWGKVQSRPSTCLQVTAFWGTELYRVHQPHQSKLIICMLQLNTHTHTHTHRGRERGSVYVHTVCRFTH